MRYTNIAGFFGYGKLYEEVITNAKDGDLLVELGSFRGRSTSYLLELANKSGKDLNIFAVDHFKGSAEHAKLDYYTEFSRNMSNLDYPYDFTTLINDSVSAASQFEDNSIDFIMIDASHDYDNVKKDIEVWWPKLKVGGMFSGDDYDWDGVSKAVKEKFPQGVNVYPRTGGDCCYDIYAGNYWTIIK